MRLITDFLWIFTVTSFLGWIVNFLFRTIKKRRLVNPGFLTLPFMPSYGLASMIIYILYLVTDNIYMIALGSGIILTVAKYFVSMLFEKAFGFKWHDYDKKIINLNGYVSAWEPFLFAGLAALGKAFVFPHINFLVDKINIWVALIVPGAVIALIIVDFILTTIIILRLRTNLRQMKNISNLLKSNSSKLDDDALRERYQKKMFRSHIFRRRLVNAFPDMESINYEKQLRDLKAHLDDIKERNDKVYVKEIENDEDKPFAYGLSLSKLFWLFFVGCFFGTLIETVWALFAEGHFEMRVGMVWGPFIPVYGGGAVAITLCLYKLHKANDIVIYLASAVIGATFEYFSSFFLEKTVGMISWDYSDTPFNIDGRTNLMFALIWGLLGLTWLRYIYPAFSRMIEKIPKKIGSIITIILFIFMAIDGVMTMTAIYRQNQRAVGVKPSNAFTEWIDNTFDDEYLEFIFPHMGTPEEWEQEISENTIQKTT